MAMMNRPGRQIFPGQAKFALMLALKRIMGRKQGMESWRMVHFHKMTKLVQAKLIKQYGRKQQSAPIKANFGHLPVASGTAAPTSALVANSHGKIASTEFLPHFTQPGWQYFPGKQFGKRLQQQNMQGRTSFRAKNTQFRASLQKA